MLIINRSVRPSVIITVRLNKAKDLITKSTEIKKLHSIISEPDDLRNKTHEDEHLRRIVHTKPIFNFLIVIVIIVILNTCRNSEIL